MNGINNNVEEMTITVSALGVRLVALDENGQENVNMVNQTINPSIAEGFTWPVILKHEGTGQESVKLQLSQVQTPTQSVMIYYSQQRTLGHAFQICQTFHTISDGPIWRFNLP